LSQSVPVWIAILAAVRASNTGRSVDFGAPVSAADPLNLVGVILPGERVPAISGKTLEIGSLGTAMAARA
jgi:hypothetical protein